MTSGRTSRKRRASEADRRAAHPSDAAEKNPPSPSWVLVGLCAILLAVPLAVLGSATGPFDDPKASAFLIIASATGLGWLIGPRGSKVAPSADRGARLLRWAILAYLGWCVVTTVTSIAPGQSTVGAFGRGMGLLTVGPAVLLFFLVQSECRSAEAVQLLIDAALLGSVPVCLLAVGQAFGWNPFPKSWDPAVASLRVRSTFGQHIFLASYLAILVPLAAGRLDWAWREASGSRRAASRVDITAVGGGALWTGGALGLIGLASRWSPAWWMLPLWGLLAAIGFAVGRIRRRHTDDHWIVVALVSCLVVLQAAVIVLSQARGALLGMLFGLSVAGLILYGHRRSWRGVAAVAVLSALLIVGLLLMNIPNSPLAPLVRIPVLSRLGHLTDFRRETPGWFRLEVWKSITSNWGRQMLGETIVPDTDPRLRSVIGYGLDTQLLTLDRLALPRLGPLRAAGEGWQARYLVDRAHDELLDQLVTGGVIGAGLWLLLVGLLLAVGLARLRHATPGVETSVRLGSLAAALAHLVAGLVGITTTVSLALFWLVAGLLALPPWSDAGSDRAREPAVRRRAWWLVALAGAVLAVFCGIGLSARWLLASVAYAEGTRQHLAGQAGPATESFRRAVDWMPLLPLPAEAFAYSALRLAAADPSPERRLALLGEAEGVLEAARRHALGGATTWTLTAQIALAEARAGDRRKLATSLFAYERAVRLRPDDPQLLSELAWAQIESGDPGRARETAGRALSLRWGEAHWLAWAALSRAAYELGDSEVADRAGQVAKRRAPSEARRVLDSLLR